MWTVSLVTVAFVTVSLPFAVESRSCYECSNCRTSITYGVNLTNLDVDTLHEMNRATCHRGGDKCVAYKDNMGHVIRGCGDCETIKRNDSTVDVCGECTKDYCNKPLYCIVCEGCGDDKPQKFQDQLCDVNVFSCIAFRLKSSYTPPSTPEPGEDDKSTTLAATKPPPLPSKMRLCGDCNAIKGEFEECDECDTNLCNKDITCYICDNCDFITPGTTTKSCKLESAKARMYSCSTYMDNNKLFRRCGSCESLGKSRSGDCEDCVTNMCNNRAKTIECYHCISNHECDENIRNGFVKKCTGGCVQYTYYSVETTYRTCGLCQDRHNLDAHSGMSVGKVIDRCDECFSDRCNDGIYNMERACKTNNKANVAHKSVAVYVDQLNFDDTNPNVEQNLFGKKSSNVSKSKSIAVRLSFTPTLTALWILHISAKLLGT